MQTFATFYPIFFLHSTSFLPIFSVDKIKNKLESNAYRKWNRNDEKESTYFYPIDWRDDFRTFQKKMRRWPSFIFENPLCRATFLYKSRNLHFSNELDLNESLSCFKLLSKHSEVQDTHCESCQRLSMRVAIELAYKGLVPDCCVS